MTSSGYRDFDQGDEYYDEPGARQGGLGRGILIWAAVLAVLMLAGSVYAVYATMRQPAPRAPASAARRLAAFGRQYLAIASPSDKVLDPEEDAYADNEKDNLAAAEADLRAQVATEKAFDRQLAAIRFPGAVEATAQALIKANEGRFEITERQARSKTLGRLRSLDARREAGNAAVEAQVALLRKQLHLPPESDS